MISCWQRLTPLALDALDPFKCNALLGDGQWLDAPASRPFKRPFQKWQPPGCLMHEYKTEDIRRCAGSRKMLFVGDTNTRQIFWAVAKKINPDAAYEDSRIASKHGNIHFKFDGLRVDFIWDPYLNSSTLAKELELYQENGIRDNQEALRESANKTAAMILLGGGLWHARQYDVGAVRRFKNDIEKIVKYTTRSPATAFDSQAPFLAGNEGVGDIVFVSPVEEPLYAFLSPSRKATILPEEVDQMNGYLHQLSPQDGLLVPWVYEPMVGHRPWAYGESGLHVIDTVSARRADILLNMRCNAKLDRANGPPFERTCCSSYRPVSLAQWILFGAFAVILLLRITLVWEGKLNLLSTSIDKKLTKLC